MRIIKHRPPHLLVVSGDDPITLPIIAGGGDGVISVIGNAYPKSWSTMVNAALRNDMPAARDLNLKMWDLHKWLYHENNPAGIKAAMTQRGLCTNLTRLPLVPLSDATTAKLLEEMALVGLDA
jgi:4-hydroxy-tetrahydrodipicolinate synthase